jgi:hypothetical protein
MFVRTMIDRGRAEYCDRNGHSAGSVILSPCAAPRYRSHLRTRPLFRLVVSVLLPFFVLLAGCSSSPDSVTIPDPYFSGVRHFDVAFTLVQEENTEELVKTYAGAASRFIETSRIERAQDTLRSMNSHVDGRNEGIDLPSRVERVTAWHLLAGQDESAVPAAREYTTEILSEMSGLAGQDPEEAVSVLLLVLQAQLGNPNLQEDSLRRTLDELYLINNDAVRVAALVRAAEYIAGQDDPRTLNPVVQQSIAVLPVIESPLLSASLAVRLAVLSTAIDRPGDVTSLLEQARRRSEEGLIVEEDSWPRIEDMIDGMVALESSRTARPSGSGDFSSVLNSIVSNISPQSMRLRSQGAVLLAYSEEEALGDIFSQMVRIGDPATRMTVSAEFIRNRARRYSGWMPGPDISTVLGRGSLVGLDPVIRIRILSDLASAYYYAGEPEELDRLRGLIGSIDEYNRVLLRVAEEMMEANRPDDLRRALGSISGIPGRAPFDDESPRLREARLYRHLGEYDRAISVAEGLPSAELAPFLVTLPADFLPNPVSNAVLDRMVNP